MKFLILWSLIIAFASAAVLPQQQDIDVGHLTTPEIIEAYGYPSETHKVQTDDGYLLTLHRIPYGKKCGPDQKKGVILVQHGIFCSSADWVLLGPELGLGFILADRCFDVWLGNSRGNYYSKEHVSLDVNSSEYWNFSWHQMGIFDLPAVIDYILHKTKETGIWYAGHSQGTTQTFVLGSERPEYAAKIKGVFAMAPIAYLGHSKSLCLQVISEFQGVAGWVAGVMGMNEFFPNSGFISQVGEAMCKDSHPDLEGMCSNILFLATGFDSEQFNLTTLEAILGHTPAGSSTKELLHYAQSFNTGEFRQFDHGSIENLILYGSLKPPAYKLEGMPIHYHLYYSNNDWLAALKDVEKLKKELRTAVASEYVVPYEKFNHADYMYAIDVVPLVYGPMIDKIEALINEGE